MKRWRSIGTRIFGGFALLLSFQVGVAPHRSE
jgi:hypothetical protein